MTKGWHHEPSRHALAARGIKSRIHEVTHYVLDHDFNLTFRPVSDDDIIVMEKDSKEYVYYLVYDDVSGMSLEDIMGDASGELIRRDGPKNKIEEGKRALEDDPYAVPVSVYSHSGEFWFLPGEGGYHEHDLWDTAHLAGVWLPDKYLRDELDKLPKDQRKAKAREFARQFLETYNSITNGDVYTMVREVFTKGDPIPDETDNVGLNIGHDWAWKELQRAAKTGGSL